MDSSVIVVNDQFAAKVDTTMPLDNFWEINSRHNVEIVKEYPYRPDIFILRVTKQSDLNAMDMGNLYQDSAYAIWAAADFIGLIGPP